MNSFVISNRYWTLISDIPCQSFSYLLIVWPTESYIRHNAWAIKVKLMCTFIIYPLPGTLRILILYSFTLCSFILYYLNSNFRPSTIQIIFSIQICCHFIFDSLFCMCCLFFHYMFITVICYIHFAFNCVL